MHQPFYRDPLTGEYELPWALLHGTKDYYDMAAILDDFPDVHQTFNMVPSLIEQLRDYENEDVPDLTRSLTRKSPAKLNVREKKLVLQRFFQANWQTMIKPYPRYWELLEKRGFSSATADIEQALRYYTDSDFFDLQVLFNLSWIDPQVVGKDAELMRLRDKGRAFSEADKKLLLSKQCSIIRSIIPKYRELMDRGTIEVTTSPYFHPILPLLCDSESAREAEPHIHLPSKRFIHPDDAAEQLLRGIRLHTETFGRPPKGLWPSEGSVSQEVLKLIGEAGIEWIATDEEILSETLGRGIGRDEYGNSKDSFIYRPYILDAGSGDVKVVFRDHVISDLIGFHYATWDAEEAADNLIVRLAHIRDMVDNPESHMVSIILDGENAWETYPNDGHDFLSCLYSKLSEDRRLRCVTVGEFLSGGVECDRVERIFPGSWINHNFRVWIGHIEDNTAWDHISDAREALVRVEEKERSKGDYDAMKDIFKEAWKTLYAAEGSDWFWWYGDIHSSDNDDIFDSLFRKYIKRVYTLIGLKAPLSLEAPISSKERGVRPTLRPSKLLEPVLDGEVSSYFEWLPAGLIEHEGALSGAMHTELRMGGIVEKICYGFNMNSLFLRLDYLKELGSYKGPWNFDINILHPRAIRVHSKVEGSAIESTLFETADGVLKDCGELTNQASGEVVEMEVPFAAASANPGEELWLYFTIDGGEHGIERWPARGYLIIDIPTDDYGKEDWSA